MIPSRPDRLGGWSLPRRRMTRRRRRRRRRRTTGCQVIPFRPDRLGGWSLPNQHIGMIMTMMIIPPDQHMGKITRKHKEEMVCTISGGLLLHRTIFR